MNFHKVDINQQMVTERKRSHFSATTSVNKNDMPRQEAGRPQNTNELSLPQTRTTMHPVQ